MYHMNQLIVKEFFVIV